MALTINVHPSGKNVYRGGSAYLYCSASGGVGTVTYTWQYRTSSGSVWISTGSTGQGYNASTSTVRTMYYRCLVKDSQTTVASNSAAVTVSPTPVPSAAVSGGGAYYRGSAATLQCNVSVAGGGSLSYQWQASSDGVNYYNVYGYGNTYSPSTSVVGNTTYYRCAVTYTLNGYSTQATSSATAVTTRDTPTPSITARGGGTYFVGATNVTVKVDATVLQGTLTYQWERKPASGSTWSSISGATSSSYSISTSSASTYDYRCVVTNTLNGYTQTATSETMRVTVVNLTASISGGGAVYRGQSSTLTCTPSTTSGSPTYTWQYQPPSGSWINLPYNTASITVPNTGIAGTYTYRCTVKSTLSGYTKTAQATTTVTVNDTPTPTVTISGGGTVYVGGRTNITSSASTASGTLSYQWRKSSNGSVWSDIGGATSSSYSPANTSAGTTYYRVVVTNTLNGFTKTATSNSVTVTVNPTPAPTINSQSVNDATYYRGGIAQPFSCSATSSQGSVSYQWQRSANGSSWSNISGATSSSYTPPAATVGTTYYRCYITNTLNGYTKSATTGTARIIVNGVPTPTLTSSASIKDANYYMYQSAAMLNASATAAAGAISYQWQKSTDGSSWQNMAGETTSFFIPDTNTQGTNYYRAVITNTLNGYTATLTTSSAKIVVSGAPTPQFTRNPASATYYLGDTASAMSVSATVPVGTITYQWQVASGSTWQNIPGENATTYTPDTSSISRTSYRCVATNSYMALTATANSAVAIITVLDTPTPAFTNEYSIRSATYKQGATAQAMDGTATSAAGTITYQWQRKNANGEWVDIPGATAAKYTPSTANIGSESYRVIAINTLNGLVKTITSGTATITTDYAQAPAPTFTSAYNVNDATYYIGDIAKALNASATSAAGTITYQWQQSANGTTWTDIGNATDATYTPSASAISTTYYRCVVTNSYGGLTSTLTSNEAKIVVQDTPSPTFVNAGDFSQYTYWQGAYTQTPINGTASVPAGVVTYQWQRSTDGTAWTDIAGSVRATYTPPTTEVGTTYYRVIATNTLNRNTRTATSPVATVTVQAATVPAITQDPQSATYYVADEATPLTVAFETPTQPISYQWQRSTDGETYTDISGATQATYTPPTSTAGTVYYRAVVSGGYAGYTASTATSGAAITVNVPEPVFLRELVSTQYNLRANPQALDATASAPGCVITYQWQTSSDNATWQNVVGETQALYYPPTAPRGTEYYRCIATASNNGQSASATSNTASILIYGGQAPVFERRLQSAVYKAGDGIRPLNGTASSQDTMDITYQWYWSRDNVSFLPVNGATSPFYTPSSIAGTAYYYVVATAHFEDGTQTTNRSNTASISVTNEQYDFGGSWRAYLQALKTSFTKLARLEFLQPDGSVAFALDNNPMNRRSGAFIQSGQLTVNLQNGQRRTATVTLANLDSAFDYNVNKVWFGQQILLSEGLLLPNGQEFYLPQGVFYIRDPEEKLMPGNRSVTYHLEDKWSYLNGSLFGNLDGVYEIPLNTNIFDAIQSVLDLDRGNGQPVDNVAPVYTNYYNNQMTTLPGGSMISDLLLPYTYRNDSENGTYADIVLEMSNIVAAWVGYDATGRLRIDPSQDDIVDASKPVQWEFRPDEKQFLGATYTVKNSDVYNDVIITGESLSGFGHIAGRAQNLDPSSDTNINIIGLKTHKESAAGYYTEKQCENLAIFRLKQQTVLQKSVTIQSAQLFHISENQLVMIRRPDKPGTPMERHLVTGFTRPIAQTGAMQINATSVNDFLTASVVYPGGQSRTSAILVGAAVLGSMTVVYAEAK